MLSIPLWFLFYGYKMQTLSVPYLGTMFTKVGKIVKKMFNFVCKSYRMNKKVSGRGQTNLQILIYKWSRLLYINVKC